MNARKKHVNFVHWEISAFHSLSGESSEKYLKPKFGRKFFYGCIFFKHVNNFLKVKVMGPGIKCQNVKHDNILKRPTGIYASWPLIIILHIHLHWPHICMRPVQRYAIKLSLPTWPLMPLTLDLLQRRFDLYFFCFYLVF